MSASVNKLQQRYRYSIILLKELVRTDFKLRYQGSVLGYAWSLLRPLLLFVILYIVFVRFLPLKSDLPHYPIYLLLGIILWNFFAETTSQSLSSIVSRGDIIRKIQIPRWTVVLSSSVGALINLCLSLVIVLVFMIFSHLVPGKEVIFFPFAILQLYLLALGLALFLSALYVKYRDISYIWEVCLQGLFYLTPVIYPLQLISNPQFQKLLLINPVATGVQNAREYLVTNRTITGPDLIHSFLPLMFPYAITLFIFIVGVFYFRSQAKNFAENL